MTQAEQNPTRADFLQADDLVTLLEQRALVLAASTPRWRTAMQALANGERLNVFDRADLVDEFAEALAHLRGRQHSGSSSDR